MHCWLKKSGSTETGLLQCHWSQLTMRQDPQAELRRLELPMLEQDLGKRRPDEPAAVQLLHREKETVKRDRTFWLRVESPACRF
jgi:hypothetical protein